MPTTVRTRAGREQWGDLVMDCLTVSVPTLKEAMEITGLTREQWRAGVAYVRDVLAEISTNPIVYDHKTGRYSLAVTEDESLIYAGRRLQVLALQLQRLHSGTMVPQAAKSGKYATWVAHSLTLDIEHLADKIGVLTEMVGVPETGGQRQRRRDRERIGLAV